MHITFGGEFEVFRKPKDFTIRAYSNKRETFDENPYYVVFGSGKIYCKRTMKYLQPKIDADGHDSVLLDKTPYKVHMIVASQFIPNPNNKVNVIHIDGNLRNNRALNLKWD